MPEIVQIVEAFISSHILKPYELYAVEWERRGVDWVLSILIDKSGGITIDETVKLSEIISPLLDTIKPDPFPNEGYLLEVASPGAERPLKKQKDFHLAMMNDETVSIHLYQKMDGMKELTGKLKSVDDEIIGLEIFIKTRTKIFEIPIDAIAKAQTMVVL